jgi:hypothetical protein
MGQKTVRFSDLSGQLILDDDALARIVVHEHPELGDGPVEIEAMIEEAEAICTCAMTSSRAGSSWKPMSSTSWPPTTR